MPATWPTIRFTLVLIRRDRSSLTPGLLDRYPHGVWLSQASYTPYGYHSSSERCPTGRAVRVRLLRIEVGSAAPSPIRPQARQGRFASGTAGRRVPRGVRPRVQTGNGRPAKSVLGPCPAARSSG